jgi:hypothetical protein
MEYQQTEMAFDEIQNWSEKSILIMKLYHESIALHQEKKEAGQGDCYFEFDWKWDDDNKIIVWVGHEHSESALGGSRQLGELFIGFGEESPDGILIWKYGKDLEMRGTPESCARWIFDNMLLFEDWNYTGITEQPPPSSY